MATSIAKANVLLAPNQSIPFNSPFVKYPIYASRKFDGWRLIIKDGQLLSRTGKPYRNLYLPGHLKQAVELTKSEGWVFDGEIYDRLNFNELSSMFASFSGKPRETTLYNVFDLMTRFEWENGTEPSFEQRIVRYETLLSNWQLPYVVPVEQIRCNSSNELETLYDRYIEDGFEGIIARSPFGKYKHGRSTLNEGIMFKFKSVFTWDGVIVGFKQGRKMKDEVRFGERVRDVRGFLERDHKKDSYELEERIGSVLVKNVEGVECGVGFARGFKEVANKIGLNWENREKFIGKWVEVKSQAVGVKDKARMGAITRMRPDLDGMTLEQKKG